MPIWLVGVVLLAAASPSMARIDQLVRSSDGTVLAVHEWGDRSRPTIVLIHGYMQSYLSWQRQFEPLSRDFHVVAFDLRGHGESDKSSDRAAYWDDWRWADDVAAVLQSTGSERATLVGWSMGGRVIMDYLAKYGQERVASIVFVDSGLKRGPGMAGTANAGLITALQKPGLEGNIAATEAFLRGCFATQPSADAFRTMLAYNMVIPPSVRTLIAGRPLDFDQALAAIRRPTLVIQGDKDALVAAAAADYTAHQVPGARLVVIEGAGHSPFYEAPDQFNTVLIRFIRSTISGASK